MIETPARVVSTVGAALLAGAFALVVGAPLLLASAGGALLRWAAGR